MGRVAMLVLIILASIGGLTPATSAQSSTDGTAAAQTAVELSYLESIGDFNSLYDRIHPDAHAVIPRAAVIGWYQNEFWPQGPGVATVTGVRFVSWTWPVTGVTYSYTAEVAFSQPFANGTVLEDVVRLVQDDTGQWRWFFGRSSEFVEEQISRYVPQVPAAGGGVSVVDMVISDLNAYWGVSFAAAGMPYVPPSVRSFVPNSMTGCGYVGGDVGPAMYCPADQTVYYDVGWFAYFEGAIGDFAWITIMAHEWGHHVQVLGGVGGPSTKARELQADCLAGAYARDAETRGLLDEGDVTEAVVISGSSGDAMWLPNETEGAHGTSDERISAFMQGYLDGFMGCGFLAGGTGGVSSSTRPDQPPSVDISSLLPRQADVPTGLLHLGDSQRSLAQVAANYTDPAETEWLFLSWGWEGNVTRTFDGQGGRSGITMVYVSIHRLGDASGAVNALDYSVADQAISTGAWEIPVSRVGQTTRALQTSGDVTIYAQQGDIMVRLTVTGPAATSLPVAEAMVASMLSRA